MNTLRRTLQILPSVFQKTEFPNRLSVFDYKTSTTAFVPVFGPNPFVLLINECTVSEKKNRPTFEQLLSKLNTISKADTVSSDSCDLHTNQTTEGQYQYGLDQKTINRFNDYIDEITTQALDEEEQSQETIRQFHEQIQKEIERLKKPKETPSLENNPMRLCKVFNEKELQSSEYLQTRLFREAINLCQLHHPAIVSFAGFNMYNSNILFHSKESADNSDSEYFSDEETVEETKNTKVEEEALPMIKTSPTIFLEPVEQSPNLDNLLNSGCTRTFGPNQIPWNATKAYIFILGLTHAVFCLHRNGIIHRNLLPKVIHFDDNFYPKLIDFSTSRQINANKGSKNEPDTQMTEANCQDPAYQAYEILEPGNENYDSSIDVFSLGRLIYAIIAKCHPFKHPNESNNYSTAKYSNNSLQSILPKSHAFPFFECIPEPYQKLLTKCWDPNPSQRYLASQIYDEIKSNLDIYKTIYPNDEVDMNEVNQYIQRLEESEKTLPICLCSKSDENVHIPQNPLPTILDTSKIQLDDLHALLDNYIYKQFVDFEHHERPLHLFLELISRSPFNRPLKIISAYFNSAYFNKLLESKNKISLDIIDKFFGTEEQSQIGQKNAGCIRFPSTTEKIEAESFSGLPECQFIYIPASVKEIGDRAFANCPKLQFVFIPRYGKLSKIGEGAFANCSSLYSFSFPDKVKTVPPHAFENDTQLEEIDFNKIEDIEPYAFAHLKKIQQLEFPPTLKSIKEHAFKNIPYSIPYHFSDKPGEESHTKIARNAFPYFYLRH